MADPINMPPDPDMQTVQMDAEYRRAHPAPIDMRPAVFAQRNPGPPDPLNEGVRALATGKDPQHAMAAALAVQKAPTQGSSPDMQPNGQPTAGIQPEDRAPLKWDQIVKTKGYLDLDLDDRESARQQYFNQIVAPQVDTDDLPAARKQFNAATTGAAGYALLPNDDDARIGDRAERSRHLQQLGIRADIADQIALKTMPPLDSRTKAMMDQGARSSGNADQILGLIASQAAGTGAISYLKQLLTNRKAASAAAAEAAEAAKFARTPADEILAKDAAANPPKVNPDNPFGAWGGTKGSEGVVGSADSLSAAERAELAGSSALRKAYAFAKSHPALSTATGAGLAGGLGAYSAMSGMRLAYHIAQSIKGLARVLPDVLE